MSGVNFNKWVQAFKNGCKSDVSTSTTDAAQAVEDMITTDRRVTLDETVRKLDMFHNTFYAIVHKKLHFSVGFLRC